MPNSYQSSMDIIKLNATDSTNQYLKALTLSNTPQDFTVVVAKQQHNGRGQMGTIWESETGKNLTFSVLKRYSNFNAQHAFNLNMHVSLALYNALKRFQVPKLSIKWPNDIMSGSQKICGILIENLLSGQNIQSSIIGIGLNINQIDFGSLHNVSSLKLVLGKPMNIDEIMHAILQELHLQLNAANISSQDGLKTPYEAALFRKDKLSTFTDTTSTLFMGFIRGVSPEGKLRIALEDEVIKEYNLKEVQLLY